MEDRINIIEPHGVRRSRPIPLQGLVIGRGTDSDLIINYNNASRHHAKIFFDGADYYVVDLGSTNGTYLADVRLSPNNPELWRPGQPLRIGDIMFELELGKSPDQPQSGDQPNPDQQETQAGWVPGETGVYRLPQAKKSSSSLPLILLILSALLLLAALAAAAYFLFF